MPKDKSSFDTEGSIVFIIKKSDMKKILRGSYNLTVKINNETGIKYNLNEKDSKSLINERNKQCLTNRELEVLKNIAKGKTNLQIANDLTVSKYTIKSHVTNILQKLNVDDRLQAVVKAMNEKII